MSEKLKSTSELLKKLDQLHSAPSVALGILRMTRDPDFNLRELAKLIESDPALTAKLLKTANSSRYGRSHHITSVQQAANFIGARSLRLIALTFGLVETLARGAAAKLYSAFWKRALTMATVASRLAADSKEIPSDEAYTCALLSDVGVLMLAQCYSEEYVKLYKRTPHGPELMKNEREQFGFDHAEIGKILLERWELSEHFLVAVQNHHFKSPNPDHLESIVYASNLMADALWIPKSPNVVAAKSLLEREFDYSTDKFIDLALDCRDKIQESAEELMVPLDGEVDCNRLIDEARAQYLEDSITTSMEYDSLMSVIEGSSVRA